MASTKQNTPGLGIEYEVHLPAYFALLLNTNPEIEDFKLRSNVQEFGNLDDLLVDIKTKSGENLYFAFQLKHKEKSSKNLLPTNFEARGDFNLEKYCEAFKNLSEENRKKYYFILYTNKNFDFSRTNEVQKFYMKQDEICLGRNFFDTSGNGKNLYRFEVNEETEDGKNVNKDDYREFFSKFSLYTGQTNTRDLDKSHILDILKYQECYVKYVDFFRRWHRGDFIDKILDKKTLNIHLVDILLSPVAINYHVSDGQDGNSIFFEALVQQFDVTIIDASKQDFIKELEKNIQKYPEEFNKNSEAEIIKLGKRSKLIDRFTKEVNEETKLKLLHYFYQKPLILDFHESSKDVIYQASKLCRIQENSIKLVIVGRDTDASKFSHLKIFTNLTGVDGNFLEEMKRRCKLSLQGRNISFEEIFEEEIREFVTPREIFQMLKGSFSIGEDKENLPEYYIPRTVSATVFDIESIIKHSSGSTAIIFYYEDKFEELKILIQNIVDREDYLYEDFLDSIILRKKKPSKEQLHQDKSKDTLPEIPAIILRKEECSRKQFNKIHEELRKEEHSKKRKGTYSNDRLDDISEESEEKNLHLFKLIDEKRCLLLMSTKNISYNKNYKFTKMSVEENNIHVVFNDFINILCAQPGMGKSTLIKYLKNEYDPNFWTLRVELKAHNQFLKRNHKIDEILNYFFELENCQNLFLLNTKKMFLEKRKIVFFLDGLDEVEDECVDRILNITRELSEMGFRIWLSSRQNLQQKIEHYFNNFAIEINELNENQQKDYIENKLKSLYNQDEIEEIVDTIFSNTDLVNNCQILEIPLQLHIITKIFLDDKSYYFKLRENSFILTKMFEVFFEGKYKHYLAKIELKHNHFLRTLLEEKFENYEIVALHSVLDDEHFQKLQIENLKLTQIKNTDFLGIITEINSENKAVFEHLTFAEYFASRFLVKNFDKTRLLKDEIFAEKYRNLRLIFNIMLAEDSPLHLAIIYKDLGRIEEMGQSSWVDEGGRNFLQVAACVATRHPLLESYIRPYSSECVVKDQPVWNFKGEDSKNKEIVDRLLSSEPFKNDKIFEWNSLDYALATGAMYVVEAILEKSATPPNFCKMLDKYYSDEVVAYYSIRFGYHRLLSEILAKKSCHVTGILSDYLWWKGSKSILHFVFMLDCTNRTRIVEMLTGDDNINKIVCENDRWTFLHFAVLHEDIEFIKFLLQKRADVNVKDKDWWSPLLWAVRLKNLEISKLLIDAGANVNIIAKDGKCPMFWALKHNKLDIAKLLIENRADVNIIDEDEWFPLFWAIEQDNFDFFKLLVEKGADVNIKGEDGRSPLVFAVNQNNFEISKLLVDKGADVNVQDKHNWSPLLYAVKENNFDILKFLIEEGASVNIANKKGVSLPLFLAVKQENLEISKLLIENGADVNVKDKVGWSPLFSAVGRYNLEITKLLVENGADVNHENMDKMSLLIYAITLNDPEIVKLLVEKGAHVNIKDKFDKTPLFYAIKRFKFEIVKLLIEKGANVNIKDKDGQSPLFLVVAQGNLEMSKLLIEKGADVNIKDKDQKTPLYLAVKRNNLEISKLLLERGAEVNHGAKRNKSFLSSVITSIKHIFGTEENVNLLRLASQKGYYDLVQILIEKGAIWDPQIILDAIEGGNIQIIDLFLGKSVDLSKMNALHHAVKYNKVDVVNHLIEKGANVNFQNNDGFTILHEASSCGHLKIVEFLLNNPKTAHLLHVPGKKGSTTCLHLAVYYGRVEVVEFLLKTKIDLDKIDIHNSVYPLHFATINGRLNKELLIRIAQVVRKRELPFYLVADYLKNDPAVIYYHNYR